MSKQEYPEKVLQQQEAIRESGVINMFDYRGVQQVAREQGSDELAEFIEKATTQEYFDMAEEARRQFGPKP